MIDINSSAQVVVDENHGGMSHSASWHPKSPKNAEKEAMNNSEKERIFFRDHASGTPVGNVGGTAQENPGGMLKKQSVVGDSVNEQNGRTEGNINVVQATEQWESYYKLIHEEAAEVEQDDRQAVMICNEQDNVFLSKHSHSFRVFHSLSFSVH